MPFGEELTPDATYRKTDLKYNYGDDIRQKFTGYQKDEETKLDFAEARMYENRHARFTAVDPLLASGKSANPQTFNRYIYVGNNPINVTDPLGLDWYFNGENKYKWFEDNPGKEWTAVDFGSGNAYSYLGCVDANCTASATANLNKTGDGHGTLKVFSPRWMLF